MPPEIPNKVPGYPEWSGIRHILNDFDDDQRIWSHVEYGNAEHPVSKQTAHWLNIDFEALLAEGWSGGERKILTAAYGIWTGDPISLTTLAGGEMGDHYWRLFMVALDEYREQMFPDPPVPSGVTATGWDAVAVWKRLGYVAYDQDFDELEVGGYVPVPERLATRVDWAIEDMYDRQEDIKEWLLRHGYEPLRGRRHT